MQLRFHGAKLGLMLLECLIKQSETLHCVLVVFYFGHLNIESDGHKVVEVLFDALAVALEHVEKLVLL